MGFDPPPLRTISIQMPDPTSAPNPTREISKRWTPALIADGFTPVSDFFLKNYHSLKPPIKATEAMFLVHLMSHKWDNSAPFPSFSTIAARMGVTAAAARGYARNLEKSGYLTRVQRIGQTNRFLVEPLFRALERLRENQMARQKTEAVTPTSNPEGAEKAAS